MLVPIIPDRNDHNRTIQLVGEWLYQNGHNNYIYYDCITTIEVDGIRYYPEIDFSKNCVFLKKV